MKEIFKSGEKLKDIVMTKLRIKRMKVWGSLELHTKADDMEPAEASPEDWWLVDQGGQRYQLPKTMLFMGSEECDIVVKSDSVDKRHAVITFDHYLNKFKIKDLTTATGTFVNEKKIHEQEYVTLDHMDTVRLGIDSMMYHMERIPMDSEYTPNVQNFSSLRGEPSQGKEDKLQSPQLEPCMMPSWVSKELPPMAPTMAECRGCIEEQRIAHTCNMHEEQSDIRYTDMQYDFSDDPNYLGHSQTCDSYQSSRQMHVSRDFANQSFAETDHYHNDNYYQYPDNQEYSPSVHQVHLQQVGRQKDLGCNTWPRKRARNSRNVAHIFNTDLTDTSLMETESTTSGRILRGESIHTENLPPELSTVKKSTPLYGQPTWWGEDETSEDSSLLNGSLVGVDIPVDSRPPKSNKSANSHPLKQKSFDMEDTFSQDLISGTSSLSHDSLQSHDPGGVKTTIDTPPIPVHAKGENSQKHVDHSAMAFTVDFDEDTPKKLNMSGSLSEFMPPNLRKSFKERKDKAKSKISSKETSPEAELPPTKFGASDDVSRKPRQSAEHSNDVAVSKAIKKSTPASRSEVIKRLSAVQKERKAALESKSESPKVSVVSAKGASVKTVKKKVVSSSSASASDGKKPVSKPQSTSEEDQLTAAAVLKMTENASYLIDKMFASEPRNTVSKVSPKPSKTERDHFTEHAMYHEAINYDTAEVKDKTLSVKSPAKPSTKQTAKQNVDEKVGASELHVEEDKVSETGTYTIEADEDNEEEVEARQKIDEVFGIKNGSQKAHVISKPNDLIITEVTENGHLEKESHLNGKNRQNFVAKQRPKERISLERESSMEAEAGSDLQELRIVEDNENPGNKLPEDTPTWVTQWAALTSTSASPSKASNMEAPSPSGSTNSATSDRDDLGKHSSKSGFSRRRPGTGRKLPSIPGEKASPSVSDVSSKRSSAVSPSLQQPVQDGDSSQPKAVTISSHVVSRYQDTDTESVSHTKFSSDADTLVSNTDSIQTESDFKSKSFRSNSDFDRQNQSSRSSKSSGSMDTELLLKDTETVMVAMEARVGAKPKLKLSPEPVYRNGDANESYSDNESTAALVNGDDSFVKQKEYESPRQILARAKKSKAVETSPKKPSLVRARSASDRLQAFKEKNMKRQVSEAPVSDVFSDSVTNVSDVSLEAEDSGFLRSSSKGKGKMSMTRPNRAFQLRRARADGETEPSTPGSDLSRGSLSASSSSIRTTPKSRHSIGTDKLHDSARSTEPTTRGRSRNSLGTDRTYDTTARSDASLGAQIVSKSRSNAKSTSDLFRRDGGRHSLRLMRTNSSQDTSVLSTPDTKKTDLKSIKSRLKASSQSYGLSVTAVRPVNKTPTTTGSSSRTSSPKSAERMAWKRRKEYDPRKAVADAKAKVRDTKVSDPSGRRMTRSASFTSTAELKRIQRDVRADSSADEASSCTNSEVLDTSMETRGFIPYSGRSLSSRYHSNTSEDEEAHLMVRSTQQCPSVSEVDSENEDLSRSLLTSVHQSAFTPPPLHTGVSSPEPPIPLSVFKPRPHTDRRVRQLSKSIDPLDMSFQSVTDHSLSDQSYDNILVSSIYRLSQKLKSGTDKSIQKLSEDCRLSNGNLHSPIEDALDLSPSGSDMPGWKTANQELASILNNLRRLEHHIALMNRALFPDEEHEPGSPLSGRKEREEYQQEIARIQDELKGFQPITSQEDAWKLKDDQESVESDCEELGVPDEFF